MVIADSSVTIDRPVDEVFAFVSDPVNDTKWHHNVLGAHRTSEGPLGVGSTFKWDTKFLGRRVTDIEITKYEPHRLAEMQLRSGWMKATVTYLLEADDGRTRLTRRVAIPLPLAFRVAGPIVGWAARRPGEHHVEWLCEVLER